MFKLDKSGNLIVSNGFNSGTYRPHTVDRSNVYLGETTKRDIEVRNQVRKRRLSEQRVELENKKRIAESQKRRMMLEDYKKAQKELIKQKSEILMSKYRDAQTNKGLLGSKVIESHHFIGSPFSGFGNEQYEAAVERINPDSQAEIDIAEEDIKSADAYGVKTWMESSTSEYTMDKIEDSMQSYTPGKQVMQTMVDYARQADKTLVSFPKTVYEMTDAQRKQYAEMMAKTGEAKNAFQKEIDPKIVKYGLYALAAYLLFR